MSRLTDLKKGFTLIEMLIAVLIFVALVSIAFITLSRSAASTEKADELRGKTEAARRVIDQLTNDFQYLYLDGVLKFPLIRVGGANMEPAFNAIKGFGYLKHATATEYDPALFFVLKYPDDGLNKIVIKRYLLSDVDYQVKFDVLNLSLNEDDFAWDGDNIMIKNLVKFNSYFFNTPEVNLLPNGFVINYTFDQTGMGGIDYCIPVGVGEKKDPWCSYIETTTPIQARESLDRSEWGNSYLKVNLVIKPASLLQYSCAKQNAGTCYKLETTLVPRLTR